MSASDTDKLVAAILAAGRMAPPPEDRPSVEGAIHGFDQVLAALVKLHADKREEVALREDDMIRKHT